MLRDVVGLLRCPICRAGMELRGTSLRCPAGHAFDVARQGYVSLLAGESRRPAGDDAGMVAARARFLAAGHFDPLASALVEDARAVAAAGAAVDVGAGTGWYLARTLDQAPERAGLALDVSKAALRRAARAHLRAGAVACDVWGELPVRDGVAALVLSVFAPRGGAEMARILAPGGALLVVSPGPAHLGELVQQLGLITVDERKRQRLAASLSPHFTRARARTLEFPLELGRADAEALVAMGPSARHIDAQAVARELEGLAEPIRATASVEISCWRLAAAAQDGPAA